jgi:hypothetical protein
MKFAIFPLVALLLVGCSRDGTMVAVEGPLSVARPAPVITFRADGAASGHGRVTMNFPDDICQGRWAGASRQVISVGSGSLISQYGSVYATGYSVSGGGQVPIEALLTCAKGRTIQAQLVGGTGGHGFGIAKDNDENVYKMLF